MNGTSGVIERKALIFNVQKYNVYDGPGIRTLIFSRAVPCDASGAQILRDWNGACRSCSSRMSA